MTNCQQQGGQMWWPSPGSGTHKKKCKKCSHLCAVLKKKEKKKERQTERPKVSWQAAKCCLAHFQLEWCNSGLSSSASYRSWKEALCFLGWLCSRWNVTIAGFSSRLALKRGDRAARQHCGGGGPLQSLFFSFRLPGLSILDCCSVSTQSQQRETPTVSWCVQDPLALSLMNTWAWLTAVNTVSKMMTKVGKNVTCSIIFNCIDPKTHFEITCFWEEEILSFLMKSVLFL